MQYSCQPCTLEEVLFLSPANQQSYIPGTIIKKASTPQSYLIDIRASDTTIQGSTFTQYNHISSKSPLQSHKRPQNLPASQCPIPKSSLEHFLSPLNTFSHCQSLQKAKSLYPVFSSLPGLTPHHHPVPQKLQYMTSSIT